MIIVTLTFHLMPNLEHIEHCYKAQIAKAKFCPHGYLEFAFLGFNFLLLTYY